VHEDDTQAFWVVGLKTLDHEFYGAVVLSFNQQKPRFLRRSYHTMFAREKSVMSNTMA